MARRFPSAATPPLAPAPPADAAWHVWEVIFAAGQTRQVRCTCWANMGFNEFGSRTGYDLLPAGTWHGSIGRVKVTFELVAYFPFDVTYYFLDPQYRFEGDTVVWECHELEVEPGHPGVSLGLCANQYLLVGPSLRLSETGIRYFYLVKKWEELSRKGSHEELLDEIEMHRHDEGMEVNPFLVPLYEARALHGLGRTEDALRNWHDILELTLPPDDEWRLHPAQDQAFYHLVGYYHAAGDQDRVVELWEQFKRRWQPAGFSQWAPFGLRRWMESLLPPELTGGEPPVVEALLVPEEPPTYRDEPSGLSRRYSLKYHARDPDGDIVRVEWAVWYGEDSEHPICERDRDMGPEGEIDGSCEVWIRPGEGVSYRVEAVDLKGNRGSTGILECLPPTTPGEPGDEPPVLTPSRRSAWRLVGWGMLAAALVLAWRRRRARSLRAGPGA